MKHIPTIMFFVAPIFGQGGLEKMPVSHVDAKPATARTSLTTEEHDHYVLSLVNYLDTRVKLLEALSEKRAGTDEVKASSQAENAVRAALKELQDKHGAPNCGWNIQNKEWACPPEAK